MAHESVNNLINCIESNPNIDSEKRIIIKDLAQYNDPDNYYYIYETSYTSDGNLILEIVPKNSHYGKKAENWIKVVCDECEHDVETQKMYDDNICDDCFYNLDNEEEK
tara:strand:- start:75 stop:398 length:324 start_codon:yes stop_codon:yes gene_type:complete